MRKQIVEHGTQPLPSATAERLQGLNGPPDEFFTNIVADLIRGYLRKNYGSQKFWMPPLRRMMDNKERMDNEYLLEAVKRVIREVNGKEAQP